MSYHGLGQNFPGGGYPTPIQKAPDTMEQPSGNISPISMIQTNPMLPGGEAAAGDQAMMMEMQARSGDPTAFQPASLQPVYPKQPVPVKPQTGPVAAGPPIKCPPGYGVKLSNATGSLFCWPAGVPMKPGDDPTVGGPALLGNQAEAEMAAWAAKATEAQILEKLVLHFTIMFSGQPPQHKLEYLGHLMATSGRGHLIAKAEEIAMAQKQGPSPQPTQSPYPPVEPGEAPTGQPGEPILAQGPAVVAPNPGHPVTGQFSPSGEITTYVPETGLHPAQPGAPVPSTTPPPSAPYDPGVAPITKKAAPPVGPITDKATPPVGPIPKGTGQTAAIPQGQLPPKTQQYMSTKPSGYVAAPAKKSNIVPLVAVAAGALLLSRLL